MSSRSRRTRNATWHGRRLKASSVGLASALALLLTALGGVASANHSRFEHLSSGAINGNGAFNSAFQGTSADGSRVFFETDEQLVTADADAAIDVYERSAGQTTRVTAGAINGNGAFTASFVDASADGSRVFFQTKEQLVSADTDTSQDIYERSGGQTKQVSAGAINGNGTFEAVIDRASENGLKVFFHTNEQLVGGDTDSSTDIYERSGGSTKLVSAGAINGNGAFDVFFRDASADGSRVFFQTSEPLVGGDTDSQIDVYQRAGGSTKRISVGTINGNGFFAALFDGASADGSRVYFHTNEKLLADDTEISADVYERSGTTTTRISAGQVNGNGAFNALFDGASADGSRVFFHTAEQLVGADTDSVFDLYERSAGVTKRISAGQINGNGAFAVTFDGASSDGSRVFFHTNERLVSADTDTSPDIYERSGSTKHVSVGDVNGNGAFEPTFEGASADGSRVFFTTDERLLGADTDNVRDVYERFGAKTTTRISPGNAIANAFFVGASVDGSAVFFNTNENVIASDEDNFQDAYGAYLAP